MHVLKLMTGILSVGLLSCGGSSTSSPKGGLPDAPTGLAVNVGDTAVSLAWTAPTNSGSSPVTGYAVSVTPKASTTTTVNGTAAVVIGLTNGTMYTLSVSAINAAGTGPASPSVPATPSAATPANYGNLAVPGDPNNVSGIFDPALLNDTQTNSTVWMAYTSVGAAQVVSTSMAKSTDGGQTFSYVQTVAPASGPVTVTDTTFGTVFQVCGQPTCTGRWVYETPWMIKDSSDPNSARRFKLFAHKYFLYPPGPVRTAYWLGAIVMFTASLPDGAWSAEAPVLGWTDTPPEIMPANMKTSTNTVNLIDPTNLGPCILVGEGTASVYGQGGADFPLACTYAPAGGSPIQKVVLLRTSNLAALGTTGNSFQYVSTLLQPSDATSFGGRNFNAPAMLPASGNNPPAIIATRMTSSSFYSGCYVFPFADRQAGTLIRDPSNHPISILNVPPPSNHFAGACAWDHGLTTSGIVMDDLDPSVSPFMFKILATQKSF